MNNLNYPHGFSELAPKYNALIFIKEQINQVFNQKISDVIFSKSIISLLLFSF